MRYFYDTEFIEGNRTIDLISIGVVAEDGREYYAISSEFDATKAGDWVKKNVLDRLDLKGKDKQYVKSRKQIADEIVKFVGNNPEFYGYYSSYDHVVLCWLYGRMIDLPKGWPMYTRDLQQDIDRYGIKPPKQNADEEHNALNDARWTKQAYEYVSARINSRFKLKGKKLRKSN